jgi:hypothetical protein
MIQGGYSFAHVFETYGVSVALSRISWKTDCGHKHQGELCSQSGDDKYTSMGASVTRKTEVNWCALRQSADSPHARSGPHKVLEGSPLHILLGESTGTG